MKLSKVLTSIKGSGSEKTASTSSPQPSLSSDKAASAVTEERLKQALKEATTATPAPEKVASAGSPVDGLTKIAEQVASAEHEALVKEANLYGAAVCDGFMARAAQYDVAATKVGAAQPVVQQVIRTQVKEAADGSFEKFAAENPDLIKEAAELGFQTTTQQMTKIAESAYAKGFDEGTVAVYKLGHATFVAGFENTAKLLGEIGK